MIFSNKERKLKEAFSSIKQEMGELRVELLSIKEELSYLSDSIGSILDHIEQQKQEEIIKRSAELSADVPRNAPNFTERFIKEGLDAPNFDFGTSDKGSMHIPPKFEELSLKDDLSIGNKGVSALRQQIGNTQATDPDRREPVKGQPNELQQNVERLKKALQDSFKSLTKQEFVIFSTLYQLEEELKRPVSYSELAIRSNLTPNSLRDYISKLINKKVPIVKERYNNKQILLKIAPELRNIETLDNLMRLVKE